MSKIYVIASFTAKPNASERVKALLTKFIDPSKKQDGCIFYDLYQSEDSENEFAIVDGWESEKNLEGHASSKMVADIVKDLIPLLENSPSIKQYRLISN